MIKHSKPNNRILSIAPVSRGFGFAVLDGETLANWGVKTVRGDKNKQTLQKVKEMIAHYEPGVLALEDASAKNSRRSPRVRKLTAQIAALALAHGTKAKLYSQEKVRRAYFSDGKGTKHALAEILARRFPDDLGEQLPPPRKPWDAENFRMGTFDAVALALMPGLAGPKSRKEAPVAGANPSWRSLVARSDEKSHEILPGIS